MRILFWTIFFFLHLLANSAENSTSTFMPSPDTPNCYTTILDLAQDSLSFGRTCFQNKNFSERLSEFNDYITHAAENKIQLVCNQIPDDEFLARARPDRSPPAIEISQKAVSKLMGNGRTNYFKVIMFHEFLHLVNPEYTHGYHRKLADVTIACQTCCERGLDGIGAGYLKTENFSEQDWEWQCNLCKNPHFQTDDEDLAYRLRMYDLTANNGKWLMYSTLIQSLQVHPPEVQLASLSQEHRARLCRARPDEIPQIKSILNPQVVDTILAECAPTSPSRQPASEFTTTKKQTKKKKKPEEPLFEKVDGKILFKNY